MGTATPVAGYPSKGEAIRALHAKGMTPFMIAKEVGSTPGSVSEIIRQQRRAAGVPPRPPSQNPRKPAAPKVKAPKQDADTRGIWTPEKLAKAHRLFGKIMIMVADALQVPPKELMEYGLKGVMPPMGEKQRVAQLVDHTSIGDAFRRADHQQQAQLAPPATQQAEIDADQEQQEQIELDRAADEAELAALAAAEESEDAELAPPPDDPAGLAEPAAEKTTETAADTPALAAARASEPAPRSAGQAVAPHQRAAPRVTQQQTIPPAAVRAEAPKPFHLYHLTDEAGQWLHESLEALTKNKRFAWKGTIKQMEKVLQAAPKWKVLVPERVAG